MAVYTVQEWGRNGVKEWQTVKEDTRLDLIAGIAKQLMVEQESTSRIVKGDEVIWDGMLDFTYYHAEQPIAAQVDNFIRYYLMDRRGES